MLPSGIYLGINIKKMRRCCPKTLVCELLLGGNS